MKRIQKHYSVFGIIPSSEIPMTVTQKSDYLTCGYEIFIAAISILSVFNMFLAVVPGIDPNAVRVIYMVNAFLTLLFILDFGLRIFHAESRSYYFFRDYGWADLLAVAPFLRFLRLFRIVKAYRLVHKFGAKKIIDYISRHRAQVALFILVFAVIIIIESGSYLILVVESAAPDANIKTASDAMWWVYTTITTVGYGDRFPVTNGGRLVGVLVMTTGVAVFATFAGYVANKLLVSRDQKAEKGQVPGIQPPLDVTLAELRQYLVEREKIDTEIRTRLQQLELLIPGKNKLSDS